MTMNMTVECNASLACGCQTDGVTSVITS